MNWYMKVLRKYAVFTGRARRSEFWYFMLINIVIIAVFETILAIVDGGGIMSGMVNPITILFCLAILTPSVAVCVRRLHDTGRSGWFGLLPLIPFTFLLGAVVLIVFMVEDSKPGDNKWGPNPKDELAT
ncbi:MAG: DUF805 domain-containing protein [Armatimonadota bacterium]